LPDPLCRLRPGLRALLTALAGSLLLGSCAQIEAGDPAAVPGVDPQAAPPTASLPTTLEERYPFVRFLRQGEDLYTAILTAPVNFGSVMEPQLKQFCSCLMGEAPSAELQVLPSGGFAFGGNPAGDSGAGAGSGVMKATEDLLLVRGSRADIEEILTFIDLLYNGGPQIEIQAEIFEVIDTDAFERGFYPRASELVANTGTVDGDGSGPFFRGLGGGFPSSSDPQFGSGGPGGVFSLAFVDDDILVDGFLQLLRTTEGVDVVSRPRVSTRNGVPAKLISREEIPYLQPGAITGVGITQVTVGNKMAGVELYVQPILLGGDTVHLVVNARANRIGRTTFVGTDTNGDPLVVPSLNTREATTSITVRSGQKVVIGGLRLRELRKTESKIPVLGDIPFLGWLFSSREETEVDTEVLFVITPLVKTRAPSISPFQDDIFNPFDEVQG
jgi:type II secretory pathway component GspD/PulD (secretin)